MKALYTLVLLILWSAFTHSSEHLSAAIQKAELLNAHSSHVWLKLLHYEKSEFLYGEAKSAIVSDNFFLSKSGDVDSSAELKATLEKIYEVAGQDQNNHAQCKFRGRYIWLKRFLTFEGEPEIVCEEFNKFTSNENISSISVVLATGYLGNPASYYGHVLLKLNSGDETKKSGLLDASINYGAIVPDNTDPVSYIFNGVFGGYEGGFSSIQYYFHNHNYGENELRDIWEYELNFEREEVDLIVAHAWELLGKKYQYFFFRRNCAYRLAEIIQLVDNVEIIPENYVYTIPQSLIQQISNTTRGNKNLVKAVKYYPSRQARLYKKYASLSKAEQKAVNSVVEDDRFLKEDLYADLPVASKQKSLDTLLDYYQFIEEKKTQEKSAKNSAYSQVLSERYKLPPGAGFGSDKIPASPHLGRNPSLLRFGMKSRAHDSNVLSVVLRPAYYDSLDAGAGHVSNGLLSMAEIGLDIGDDEVRIDHFDIFAVESVNSAITMLPGDRGKAWKLKLGAERQNFTCDDCLVARFQGDIGYTLPLNENFLVGGYVGGAVQENKHGEGYGFGRFSGFAAAHYDELSMRMGVENRHHIDSNENEKIVYVAEIRYGMATNHEARIKIENNGGGEVTIAYGFYW